MVVMTIYWYGYHCKRVPPLNNKTCLTNAIVRIDSIDEANEETKANVIDFA